MQCYGIVICATSALRNFFQENKKVGGRGLPSAAILLTKPEPSTSNRVAIIAKKLKFVNQNSDSTLNLMFDIIM